MKKRVIVILLCFLSSLALAQGENTQEKGRFMDRVFVGGNFNLALGQVTFVDVSPLFGYMFTDRLSAGPGFVYQYFKLRGFQADNIYGPRAFVRYNLSRQFFAYSELETLNLRVVSDQREWVPGAFVGGGYFMPIGRRSGLMFMALYNLAYDFDRSPYPRPWVFRLGLTF